MAHLLPVVIFAASIVLIYGGPDRLIAVICAALNSAATGVGILLLLWTFALLLLALNRSLVRFLEGYGKWNPLRPLAFFEMRSFRDLQSKLQEIEERKEAAALQGRELSPVQRAERMRLHLRRAFRFPDQERWVLPTSFGNTIRSFEVYPRLLYGMESVECWYRLVAVVPKDFMSHVEDAKAQVDVWLNLWFLSSLIALGAAAAIVAETVCSAHIFHGASPHVIGTAAAIASIAYLRAVRAAEQWGRWVRALFDLFRSALAEKVGLTGQLSLDDSKRFWSLFGRAITYGEPKRLADIEAAFPGWRAVGSRTNADPESADE